MSPIMAPKACRRQSVVSTISWLVTAHQESWRTYAACKEERRSSSTVVCRPHFSPPTQTAHKHKPEPLRPEDACMNRTQLEPSCLSSRCGHRMRPVVIRSSFLPEPKSCTSVSSSACRRSAKPGLKVKPAKTVKAPNPAKSVGARASSQRNNNAQLSKLQYNGIGHPPQPSETAPLAAWPV